MTIEDMEHASFRRRDRDAGKTIAVDFALLGLDTTDGGDDLRDDGDRTGPARPASRPGRN